MEIDDRQLPSDRTPHPGPLPTGEGTPPWREWEFWALAALASAIYFSRIADLPIRGEETRRAMVAWEIVQTGDWIVPRQQGAPFLSRPPVGSWPIAWLTAATGDLSLVAVRLPSVLATVLTTLLVYTYSRQFLSRLGALSSGLAYSTFAQVLQLGRVAETEALFTLLVSAALLSWHHGYSRRWPAWRMWCVTYALAAVAALVKSMQAPVYLCGAVGMYLVWRRDWRTLVSRAHLAGIAAFFAILAAWQVPFYQRLGWDAVRQVWSSDVGLRLADVSPTIIVRHLATYPWQVLACLLPWSLLLPAYAWTQFRRAIGAAAPMVEFLTIAWLVALPTCWLVPNAKPRYLMPLYPLAAPLVGLVVERVFESRAATGSMVRLGWQIFVSAAMGTMLLGGAAVVAASWAAHKALADLAQPRWFALVYMAAALVAIAMLFRFRSNWSPRAGAATALILAAFMGLTASGVAVNSLKSADPQAGIEVALLKERLPKDTHLVSFGQIETMFTYHWREPVQLVAARLPRSTDELPPGCDYFCFNGVAEKRPALPFPWREDAVISCDRRANEAGPDHAVIVGHRVEAIALLPDDLLSR
jgi:4-amino-4-deoxy-L-arabinose transferase-like glycosyltransferase